MNIFQRIWNFFFGSSKAEMIPPSVSIHEPDHEIQPFVKEEKPSGIIDKVKAVASSIISPKKESPFHRIPPDYSCMPKGYTARKNHQYIIYWDGRVFPGRWRHKIIIH